jgi:DivIVA domain-containing protein
MSITVQELKDIQFQKAFRGYDRDSVDSFMYELIKNVQILLDEKQTLAQNLSQSNTELNRLKEVEILMLKTMKEADDKAAHLIADATAQAAQIAGKAQYDAKNQINTAKIDADDLLLEAKEKARTILSEANAEKEQLLKDANLTIEQLKEEARIDLEASEMEYNSLDFAKKQLIDDLNSLLGNTGARLSNIETKYKPENFNARKVSISKLRKAGLVESPAPVTIETKKIKISKKNLAQKPIKTTKTKTVKTPKSHSDEDFELPTVTKILAAENLKKEPAHLPSEEPAANTSFFDLI